MGTSERDIKLLWGGAAGRCSKPGCATECIRFLDPKDPTVIGEMAHVIAKSPKGPRGVPRGGTDTYDNLILLCPTHHREVDKAPDGVFPAELLQEWKAQHEERVRNAFDMPRLDTPKQLGLTLKLLLARNKAVWKQYGPESDEAIRNPLSTAQRIWVLRKLDTIVPNNRRALQIIDAHSELLEAEDFDIIATFAQHAAGFEQSCYDRVEGVPRFPLAFEEMINRYANIQ